MNNEICGECGARLEPPAQTPPTTMPTTDHEDSRGAFEAIAFVNFPEYHQRRTNGDYVKYETRIAWLAWQAALDWRDSQVCEWKYDPDHWAWETACGETYCFENEGPKENNVRHCQGCSRRVKIQPTTEDHD